MLGVLRREWAPEAFVVSFKLETDDHILIQKVTSLVTRALERPRETAKSEKR